MEFNDSKKNLTKISFEIMLVYLSFVGVSKITSTKMYFILSLSTYFPNSKRGGFSLFAWELVLYLCPFRIDQSECPFTDIYADMEVTGC